MFKAKWPGTLAKKLSGVDDEHDVMELVDFPHIDIDVIKMIQLDIDKHFKLSGLRPDSEDVMHKSLR